MGVSTDGLFFYGFPIEEGEEPWKDEKYEEYDLYDFEEYYDIIKKPNWPEEELCEVGTHCSGEYRMHFVCVIERNFLAFRGQPERIGAEELIVNPDWNKQLKDFCDRVGIKYQKPGFYLASYWG